MLIFRSEEHLAKWLDDWRMEPGAVLSLEQCWGLAKAVYGPDRRPRDWRRKTVDETEAMFAELGLTGPFWQLR
ncbi:MAG: hypothetical protein HY875_14685 [Chloroflexi bacterium]|nr:hypothetical protein [Chloroflexota bacterium]